MIEQEELITLLPHRGKMLLLNRVVEYNLEGTVRAEYRITGQCLFFDPAAGGVPAWVGFEFMAQAVSVLSGLRNRDSERKPKIGFILSIPAMKINIPVFKQGGLADIRVNEIDRTDLIYTFKGEIYMDGEKAMEGKLMVMEILDEQKFIDFINQ